MARAMSVHLGVALGTAVGGALRVLCSHIAAVVLAVAPLWSTAFVNVTGSLAIGFVATLTAPDGRLMVSTPWRQFVMVGVCGGYTTFSILSLETLDLLMAGETLLGGMNIGLSLALSLVAVWLGHALAQRMGRPARKRFC